MLRRILCAGLLVLVSACGGGGGSEAPITPPVSQPAISFSQATLTANAKSGTSSTVTIQANIKDTTPFAGANAIYIVVVDSNKVLNGSVNVTALSQSLFSLTFNTSSSLAPGKYTGNFEIHACKDTGCKSEFITPLTLPYDLTISDAPLSASLTSSPQLSLRYGSGTPISVAANVVVNNLDWSVNSDASWLQVSDAKGKGNGTFNISISANGLAVGDYTGKVNVTASDGQSFPLSFALTVLPQQFTMSGGVPSFTVINGEVIKPQTLSFDTDSKVVTNWTASSSASWLIASALTGQTPANISLLADPSVGKLSSGSYSSLLTLKAANTADRNLNIALNLIKPSLTSAQTYINFGGNNGRDWNAQSLAFQLNTGANTWPWKIDSLPSWLNADVNAGKVGQSGTSIKLQANLLSLKPGTTSAALNVSTTINGETVTLPITANINIDQRKLLPSEYGIGFSSTPLGNVVSRTINISDNFGRALSWSASSDSSWLSVAASGNTPDDKLTITADPAKLTDGLQYATVTVSTSTPGVQSATIKVAAWKSGTAMTATKLALDYSNIIADKIRPYVYLNKGGNTIDVYNVYTAVKVKSITSTTGSLANMAVSPDGARLFALDTANRKIAVFDLATLVYKESWDAAQALQSGTPIIAIRPNNVEAVVLGDGSSYIEGRTMSRAIPSYSGYDYAGSMAASSDGRSLFVQNTAISSSATAFDVDYSAISNGVLLFTSRGSSWSGSSGSSSQDMAVNPDGSKLYVASSSFTRCSAIDAKSLTTIGQLPGGDYNPNNVKVTNDGRIICGIASSYNQYDFWVHDTYGALQKGYKFANYGRSLKNRQLVVSPDSMIVIALSDDPALAFISIAP